ncbi:MAG: HTTM domain-containing protein [Crocinitomicaceae bacterium]|nr:HTTM domain-containing protein [Crocinitomicaceae bacterium]
MGALVHPIRNYLSTKISIAPLIVFRILFGGVMLAGIIRFAAKGWINELYIKPKFFFHYYGFEWVKPLGEPGMYFLFGIVGLAALFIMTGFLYQLSSIVFFLGFTYIELIDKSNYLNHYYFISVVSFLMVFLPAGKFFSIDTWIWPRKRVTEIPRWIISSLQLQLAFVYFFAGLAKLNYDWLMEAQPLRIWLYPHTNLPFIGSLMDELWVAYFFSWAGAIYDLSIPFLLSFKKTRLFAYSAVILFHVLTSILFPIGMFPFVMILATLIFFSEDFHLAVIRCLRKLFFIKNPVEPSHDVNPVTLSPRRVYRVVVAVFALHFLIQFLLPFRFLLYPGKLFWTEEGYRFSWRVMLMEKAGKAFFYIHDKDTGRKSEVMNDEYLTMNQEKMMSTQPDMILQYAHFLKENSLAAGIQNAEVTVESYVTLNGRGSRLFIDSTADLASMKEGFSHKYWVLPFGDN